jgi:hypothetical protein
MTVHPEEAPKGFNYSALMNLLMHGDELAIMALRKHMAQKSVDPYADGRDAAAADLGVAAPQPPLGR